MLEILDDPTDARSYALCKPTLGAFNFYERWLIGRALKKNQRHRALVEIMDVALNTRQEEKEDFRYRGPAVGQHKSAILTRDEMVRQTTASLNNLFEQEFNKNSQAIQQLRK